MGSLRGCFPKKRTRMRGPRAPKSATRSHWPATPGHFPATCAFRPLDSLVVLRAEPQPAKFGHRPATERLHSDVARSLARSTLKYVVGQRTYHASPPTAFWPPTGSVNGALRPLLISNNLTINLTTHSHHPHQRCPRSLPLAKVKDSAVTSLENQSLRVRYLRRPHRGGQPQQSHL